MANKTQKTANRTQGLVFLVMILAGAACGVLIMRSIRGGETADIPLAQRLLKIGVLLILFYAAYILHVIIHEAGHLVFGLLSGYQFCAFRIFNLMWIKDKEKIRLRRLSIAGTGGQCLMSPPGLVDGKIPVLLYNFGGVIMNLIASAIAGALAFACPAGSVIRTFLLFMAVLGVILALLNGLPLHMGAANNDGRNALDLAKDPEACRAFWIQMKMNDLAARGIRTKDMPREWFVVPGNEAMQNGIIAPMAVMVSGRLMDQHRFAEADELMERLLREENGIVGVYRGLLGNDRMYVELIGENRPEVLEAMKTPEQLKIMRAMKNYLSVLRTEYAYALLAKKDGENAKKILRAFEKAAAAYPYSGEVEAERELIAIAQKKAEAAMNENDDTEDKDVSSVSEDAPVSGK